jgi:hypothetical protein
MPAKLMPREKRQLSPHAAWKPLQTASGVGPFLRIDAALASDVLKFLREVG